MAELVQGVRLRYPNLNTTLHEFPDLRKGAWVRIPLLSFVSKSPLWSFLFFVFIFGGEDWDNPPPADQRKGPFVGQELLYLTVKSVRSMLS